MSTLDYYPLDRGLWFGQYSELTLRDVIAANPNYVQWCLINVHHFAISDQVIEEIKVEFPNFKLSEEAEKVRTEKVNELWFMERDARMDDMKGYDAYEGDGWAWIANNG